MHIIRIETGCSCTTVEYSKSIQPSATGRVVVKADTEGYGGSTFHQDIEVYTSDPFNEKLSLVLAGNVKKFAKISPRRLMIKGSVTEELISEVWVVPASDFDFKIESADAVDLEKSVEVSVHRDGKGFLITVKNQQNKPGIYVGKIILRTDHVSKPEIEIPLLMGLKP